MAWFFNTCGRGMSLRLILLDVNIPVGIATCEAFAAYEDAVHSWLNGPGAGQSPALLRLSFHQSGTYISGRFVSKKNENLYGSYSCSYFVGIEDILLLV